MAAPRATDRSQFDRLFVFVQTKYLAQQANMRGVETPARSILRKMAKDRNEFSNLF